MNILRQCIRFFLLISVIALGARADANPIPWPRPASMPLEDMYSYLDETDQGGLRETFTGNYYFDYVPEDVFMMKYPVPPESDSISVAEGKLPEDWHFSPGIFPLLHEMQIPMNPVDWYYIRELYPTVLPEWPGIPMIAWNGPFPEKCFFNVKYRHELLKRGNDYIYFYALGTGKYYETYTKEAIAYLDISMPKHYTMHHLFLDHTPHAFAVTCEENDFGEKRRIVSIVASAEFSSFRKDIIGHINYLRVKLDISDTVSPQVRLFYKVDKCDITYSSVAEPTIVPSGRNMLVKDHIYFNCCPEYIRMTILVNGNQVIFREKAMEEAPCDCYCFFPMEGKAGPFTPGTYHVRLINPYGKTILEKEIEIEPQLPCEGDFDHDGDVDGSDLSVFAKDFGRTNCPACQ